MTPPLKIPSQIQPNFKDQTYLFRDGANPGFHEAMADIAALAVGTPNYFKQIGLLDPR